MTLHRASPSQDSQEPTWVAGPAAGTSMTQPGGIIERGTPHSCGMPCQGPKAGSRCECPFQPCFSPPPRTQWLGRTHTPGGGPPVPTVPAQPFFPLPPAEKHPCSHLLTQTVLLNTSTSFWTMRNAWGLAAWSWHKSSGAQTA